MSGTIDQMISALLDRAGLRRRPVLPPARDPTGPYRIGLICLGNICRSPIAEVVLRRRLEEAGLGDRVRVDSGGIGDWHLGQPMDPRASAALHGGGYDGSAHRARQVERGWFQDHDVLLAMDAGNLSALEQIAADRSTAARVVLFRSFDPQARRGDRDVPDPYAGDDEEFATVLSMVERTAAKLVDQLRAQLRD